MPVTCTYAGSGWIELVRDQGSTASRGHLSTVLPYFYDITYLSALAVIEFRYQPDARRRIMRNTSTVGVVCTLGNFRCLLSRGMLRGWAGKILEYFQFFGRFNKSNAARLKPGCLPVRGWISGAKNLISMYIIMLINSRYSSLKD